MSNELARAFADNLASGVRQLPDEPTPQAAEHHREAYASRSPETIVRDAYLRALGRPPTDAELAASVAFLKENSLEEFTLALFNLNDFAYVP
jgi:hypothetical protein